MSLVPRSIRFGVLQQQASFLAAQRRSDGEEEKGAQHDTLLDAQRLSQSSVHSRLAAKKGGGIQSFDAHTRRAPNLKTTEVGCNRRTISTLHERK